MQIEVDRVGHLGVCIGHADDGRAVLIRHALPGELVRVAVTETKTSYLRADVVEVIRASPHRVVPPCPAAGPGRCGGCDWQHVALDEQRRLKAAVIREQLSHLGGVEMAVEVETLPGDVDGLGWRTRMRLAVDRHGHAGLRRHRSRTIEPINDCPIADPALDMPSVLARRWPPSREFEIGLSDSTGVQSAANRSWSVPSRGFWQIHPGAPDGFVAAVASLLSPRSGERVVDLYAGVGLFAGSLVSAFGLGESVAVEASPDAAAAAIDNLADLPVDVVCAEVGEWIAGGSLVDARPDLVVLDPPRRGAGEAVVDGIVAASPRAVAYVACDPSALGRDTAGFVARGWRLTRARAFDAFPMTAHVETIALFEPAD